MSLNPLSWFAPSPALTEAARLRKQVTLMLGGGALLALSVAVTRRSVYRRRLAQVPAFYRPNTRPPSVPPNGAMDALDALGLATLNTGAFAVLLVGGGMLVLDVCNVEELRVRTRASAEWKETQREAEEEFEEWMVGVLARKEVREEARRRVEKGIGEGK